MSRFYKTVPVSVGMKVPKKLVTNEDLTKIVNTTDEWIQTRSGIKQRYHVSDGESTSGLAVGACEEAIKNAGLNPEDIDLVLAATLSPDYYFPGIGVQIQDKMGMRNIPAIDVRGQCAGFSWALSTADAYGKLGAYKHILVVGAEVHSTAIDTSDDGRHIAVLFGDGAGAVVFKTEECSSDELPTAKNNISGIIDHVLGSDGSGAEGLCIKRPGFGGDPKFITAEDIESKAVFPIMDGRLVFKNAVRRMMNAVNDLLEKNNLTTDDIDLLVPHQANARINEMLRAKLNFPEEKVMNIIADYGNTTAATLPLCLYEAVKDERLVKGKLVVTVAFGAGFAWGANLIRW
ncbi:ketoacyl-ACP synthase III [bacterium]|nr:ketoacyl-ACP synthase III [bacterium]